MAVLKCKMCGGDLNIVEGETVAVCEYCDTKQTVPTVDNEKKMTLFSRANRLRAACEFDKASGIYENIVSEFPEEAEAYWGLLLCKYGIEYVDDPATGRKIPTCHRSSFDSIMDDENFEQVMENSDPVARKVYREEAKTIEDIRKGILEVSSKEEPYDIFICYKETDENGERTIDSVLAQDIYDMLTENGYRVFFSRITLEDKLGTAYEPYIFAALNSAKIMLAVGTDYDYYNAVWVKNEWSRFLSLIAKGEKKTLIPCYKNIDAYDIPKEFKHLQAQDMGKVGAMQDLLRGIKKITGVNDSVKTVIKETVEVKASDSVEPLLRRATMFLEDGDWQSADEYCEKVLDLDPENAQAYFIAIMSECMCKNRSEFADYYMNNSGVIPQKNFQRSIEYADNELKAFLDGLVSGLETERKENIIRLAPIREKYKIYGKYISSSSHTVGLKSDGTVMATGSYGYDECNVSKWYDIIAVSAGDSYTVGLKSDGTVVATGINRNGECNVSDWSDIVAVSAGGSHTLGLKPDGTVLATGSNENGQCNVSDWKDIVAVSGGKDYTVGLKSDGTAVSVGDNSYGQCNVSDWSDIVAVSAGKYYTVGLKSDGTFMITEKNHSKRHDILAMRLFYSLDHEENKRIIEENIKRITTIREEYVAKNEYRKFLSASYEFTIALKSDGTVVATGKNDDGQCNVSDWKDIVAVATGARHTVGLKSDGTVVATKYTGEYNYGQCNISGWKDIIAVSAGVYHTVGLKSDGTVVATGDNEYGQCNVSDWKNIVDISTGRFHTFGLKSDGTVIAIGDNGQGQCEVSCWSNIVAVSESMDHTVGLKSDGTVVAAGIDKYGRCDVSGWSNIVAVSAYDYHTVGLKSNGTVVTTTSGCGGRVGKRDVLGWKDIVAVSAGYECTVGLKSDGTAVAVGDNSKGQCNVSDWKLFHSMDPEEEKRILEHNAHIEEEIAKLNKEIAGQEAIVLQNSKKIIGSGARAKKEATAKIESLNARIYELKKKIIN